MATLGDDLWSMADWQKEHEPSGKYATIMEVLHQDNSLADDMLFREGNLPTGHKTTVRAGLPSPEWFGYNEGIRPSKGVTSVETFETGMVGSRSHIGVDIAQLGGNPNRARFNQAVAHLEAIKQGVASTLLYADPVVNPDTDLKKFPGFHYFYKNNTTGNQKQNILDAGGSGSDNTSIWLVTWGPSCYGVFNQGTKFGIEHMDRGIQDITDATTGKVLTAYCDLWKQNLGLVIEDWQAVVRIANLDISNIKANTSSARDKIIDLMIEAYHCRKGMGRAAWYVNRTIATQLHIAAKDSVKNSTLTIADAGGKPVTMFLGIPVRNVDQLVNTESQIQ